MVVVVSACLLGKACRYDGAAVPCDAVMRTCEGAEVVEVCPEVMGGLPTPREPSERVGERVLTRSGRDVTAEYERGAQRALEAARGAGAELAVLKARSPSCGAGEIYDGTFSGRLVPGNGVTAELFAAEGIRVVTEEDVERG